MSGGNKTHYLRKNHASRQPRRHIIFDTESRVHRSHGTESQTWLCGVARYLDTDPRKARPTDITREYQDPRALWRDVTEFTRSGTRTVLWAHNLAYDLRISRALELLPELGFTLQAVVLDGVAAWAKFAQDKNTLVCADFYSWASVPLARIAHDLGATQAPLPARPEHDLTGSLRRCKQDVHILTEAIMTTMEWLRDEDLGNMQITGAGQGMSAYRHKFMDTNILVHGNADLLKIERRAIWAGRTEVWRHGTYNHADLHEFDLARAYATVGRDTNLPAMYVGQIQECTADEIAAWTSDAKRAILVDCTVTTDQPLYPVKHDDRIVWPTGTYRTLLWDCELRNLAEPTVSGTATIHRAYVYTAEPLLRDWAGWILRELDTGGRADSLRKRIIKQWSRSLIGRFALQYRSWDVLGESDEFDLYLSDVTGEDSEPGAQLLHAGQQLLELGAMQDSENCLPQITGYITAACRVRLWELMNVAGLENVWYVDTDSIICNGTGARNLRNRMAHDGAYSLTYKGAIGHLELLGPRQLTIDGERRYSGVPRSGTRTGNTVTGEVWEGLGESLRNGRADTVQVVEREFVLNGNDRRRVHLDDGTTAAYHLTGPAQPIM